MDHEQPTRIISIFTNQISIALVASLKHKTILAMNGTDQIVKLGSMAANDSVG